MRKDKALPFRIAFTLIVIIIDFVVLPQVLMIPSQVKHGTYNQFELSVFGWIAALPQVFDVWKYIQPMAVAAIAWIWLTGRSLVNVNYKGDVPRPSGHGQFGTARWQTEKEIDKNFNVHRF